MTLIPFGAIKIEELKKRHGSSLILGYSKDNVLKVIHILEKYVPPNDYIITYKDFLLNKDFLRYIGFNINVYNSLVNLTYNLWNTENRINRLNLLTILKRYNKKNLEPSKVSPETASKIFELFKQIVFFQNIKKNIKTFAIMKTLVNSIMLDIRLKDDELNWLCENAEASEIILNRVLRYKYKSPVISNWVKDNFNNDFLRKRRVELIGWMLDEEINFVINRKVLIEDFEYMNTLDIKIMDKYEADLLDYNLQKDLAKTFTPKIETELSNFLDSFGPMLFPDRSKTIKSPVLNFENRFYDKHPGFPWYEVRKLKESKNFDEFRLLFLKNIDYVIKSSMIWGIGYSRLDNKLKAKLLVDYYDVNFNYTYFKLSIMNRNLDLLKWMYSNAN